ncbi:hypothetical protein BD309DRAFT_953609 [Dichomitus squalens]|nr:hypothetical protein BD309DRAFT_953609 [Dichomitus squalens]
MNNLLRTLTASQVKSSLPESELKLLLSAVKETRRTSSDPQKLVDAFYDSLEGLLHDLRMVTMDNRDAEAFLKPVAKSEVPDYYEIITNPMDLQTMLKKVKQRHYKCKKEFKDDLDLIWSNCFLYNATEDHPLRQCASRLKAKAERLLKNITDYKERTDPIIPGEVPFRGITPRVNGITLNGTSHHFPGSVFRSPSPTKQAAPLPGQSKKIQRDTTFPESSAYVRTQAGMRTFLQLERDVDEYLSRTPVSEETDPTVQQLKERLLRYAVRLEDDAEPDGVLSTVDGEVGVKRKLNGFVDDRPRKRARMHSQSPADKDVIEMWWDAMCSDEMLANGLPSLTLSACDDVSSPAFSNAITDSPRSSMRRKKKKKKETTSPDTLLYHMNNNIRTLRRVRTTHAKLTALNQSLEENVGVAELPIHDIQADLDDVIDERPWKPTGAGIDMGEENATNCLHWMGSKVLEHVGFQGTSKMALDTLASVTAEYLQNVGRTIRFICDKYGNQMTAEEIILHTLFESGITQVTDLERYIKDDVLRYGGRLTELEKKLGNAYREATTEEAWDDEALFRMEGEEEEGEFVMGNFAESFGEDFFGLKELGIADEFGLSSLTIPKRLLKGKKGGLKEGPSTAKPTEPPPPFPPPPPFIPLDSNTVDNQIGLLKSFYQGRVAEISSALVAPPPGPSHPLQSTGALIGIPPSSTSSLPSIPVNPASGPSTAGPTHVGPTEVTQVFIIPDESPSPSHTKIGPLGTINKAAPSASTAKKKSKAKPPAPAPGPPLPPGSAGVDGDAPPVTPGPPLPPPLMHSSSTGGVGDSKKGKGASTPSKKKAKVEPFPPVVMASA